jgi:7-cyano-7-deazaguanine reductase
MSNIVSDLASKHLGKVGGEGYKDLYDPSLLVAIPRIYNREVYGMSNEDCPWTDGVDVWNCYEVSAMTKKGLPVSGLLKIVCKSDSECHVESKSIKLYLNSLNMSNFGDNAEECIKEIETIVSKDLSDLLKTDVLCKFFTKKIPVVDYEESYQDISEFVDLDAIKFTEYKTNKDLLKVRESRTEEHVACFKTNLLRSNCRVTNQPDWGDLIVKMEGPNAVDYESIVKYVVSHRKTSHFHEEIVEMTFKHFEEVFKPTKLLVAAMYTRRGGIDINPIRTKGYSLPRVFVDPEFRLEKTLRQ